MAKCFLVVSSLMRPSTPTSSGFWSCLVSNNILYEGETDEILINDQCYLFPITLQRSGIKKDTYGDYKCTRSSLLMTIPLAHDLEKAQWVGLSTGHGSRVTGSEVLGRLGESFTKLSNIQPSPSSFPKPCSLCNVINQVRNKSNCNAIIVK
ncbi:hypothetical protein RRG08_031083 [Elysia crispata]|uniref:Uncharacterized protein n=1 Tax=Elysia crispata TaxID=231223 RepID=A0AAE0ZG37_9GAST|nr:hypothetical protein RRG08_031083 [Elysia crispata]